MGCTSGYDMKRRTAAAKIRAAHTAMGSRHPSSARSSKASRKPMPSRKRRPRGGPSAGNETCSRTRSRFRPAGAAIERPTLASRWWSSAIFWPRTSRHERLTAQQEVTRQITPWFSKEGAALLDLLNSLEMRGRFTGCEPYHSPFFLTIFRVPRRLGWDEKVADGTVSGVR